MSCLALFLLVLVELRSSRVDAAPTGNYPYAVTAIVNGGCSEDAGICLNSSDGGFYSTNCSANYLQTMRDFFGTSQYIIQEMYSDASCSTLEYAIGFLVTTNCSGGVVTNQFYYKSALNGSAVIEYFALTEYVGVPEGDATCAPGNTTLASADKEQVEAHTCLPISSSGGTSDIFNCGLADMLFDFKFAEIYRFRSSKWLSGDSIRAFYEVLTP
ncbi:hypothetical protein PF008_g29189 [Phytophthora fragariae]|uniref:Uncharacterized protein n=1 Tax=Phytophthora fragariae TaxID=53985 RepID=A0A6G0Q9Z2_9STRA|nr:hypothetical protein PF008_g29189 [Phytophthora fragariae]